MNMIGVLKKKPVRDIDWTTSLIENEISISNHCISTNFQLAALPTIEAQVVSI
jgi:hypothetical protein